MGNVHKSWWKEAVIYQIYPRSFKDSNGDGIGDLRGVISKLDYLANLGIDAVWLNPIFTSPNDDNGYDIADYCGIMPEFGTMDDFDELLAGLHQRNIKLILDLVANHSSDEHPWFQESRKSRANPYRDYYHWWPAENGKPAHRESYFDINRDAWMYDEQTNAYYLHYFSRKQPDLNWENPQLRKEIYRIIQFWYDKGVDGFRMDVIPFISKDTQFPPIPDRYKGSFGDFYAKGPNLHAYLREMNEKVLMKYPQTVSIAEGVGVKAEDVYLYINPERKELDMLYHFEGMDVGYIPGGFKELHPDGFSLLEFKQVYTKWDKAFDKGWGTIYLGNHDQPRMLSRWGNDSAEYRDLSAKMLLTFLLTMRATPFIYHGDELGMTNIKFDDIADYRDIESINMHQYLKANGGDLQHFINIQKLTARDNSRTPFQWDDTENAGFTKGTPWIKVNPDYKHTNVVKQEKDKDSVLHYFRNLTALRKTHSTLIYGDYELLDALNEAIYAYRRKDENGEYMVMLNFTSATARVNFVLDVEPQLLITNYGDIDLSEMALRPYQAAVLKLKP